MTDVNNLANIRTLTRLENEMDFVFEVLTEHEHQVDRLLEFAESMRFLVRALKVSLEDFGKNPAIGREAGTPRPTCRQRSKDDV